MTSFASRLPPLVDPRYYQIAILGLLLVYGLLWLDFGISLVSIFAILVTAQVTQFGFTRIMRLPVFDPLSALISSLSLCLLLRSSEWWIPVLAAFLTVASKFVLRWKNRHLFNPTNFALVCMILAFDSAWVSSGQWGSAAIYGLLIGGLGLIVLLRAKRSDITFAFLISYTLLLLGRAAWLGDSLTIPWHQLQNGAVLIFAFFMISDPKTTPDSRAGRVLLAVLVTLVAGYIQFGLYRPNGLLYALAGCCLLTPVINKGLPGQKYLWSNPTTGTGS